MMSFLSEITLLQDAWETSWRYNPVNLLIFAVWQIILIEKGTPP